jgi:hypothetical protein
MGEATYYRAEARRMLQWAEATPHGDMARRWRRLAEDYTALAEQLEAESIGRPPILRAPKQRQPVQQQQGKLEEC